MKSSVGNHVKYQSNYNQTLSLQVGMKSEGLLKEHEVRRRDLLILKYDKQRSLCDEIILRQQKLIEGRLGKGKKGFEGSCCPNTL